jgi:dihydroorotase
VPGKIADIAAFDVEKPFPVEAERFLSKSRNSCFEGWKVRGATVHVLVAGRHVFADGRLVQS